MTADAEGFNTFFRETIDRIVGSALAVTGSRQAAEDAAQEAYARAFQRWDNVSRLDRPDLWVLRVANNAAISAWRKQKKETRSDALDGAAAESSELEALVGRTNIKWGLDQLSPKERAALILRYAEDWPLTSIARQMGRNENSTSVLLSRARKRLRQILAGEELQ
jgi:RNA polymerase sigma-70 factor (ECF subfamily)